MQGLLHTSTMLFNHPVHSVMPVIYRKPIGRDNNAEHQSKLVHRQHKNDTKNDASPTFNLCIYSHRVNCSSSMRRWWTVDPLDDCWESRLQSP